MNLANLLGMGGPQMVYKSGAGAGSGGTLEAGGFGGLGGLGGLLMGSGMTDEQKRQRQLALSTPSVGTPQAAQAPQLMNPGTPSPTMGNGGAGMSGAMQLLGRLDPQQAAMLQQYLMNRQG